MSTGLESLKSGEIVKSSFIVLVKEKKVAKNGKPFADLLLGNKKGEIAAKIWDVSGDLFDSFEKGSIVEVTGKLDDFMGRSQIIIGSLIAIDNSDINFEDFLPSSKSDKAELKLMLFEVMDSIGNKHLNKLLRHIFSQESGEAFGENVLDRFLKAPAAKNFHHAYLGGLAEHSIGVANLCSSIAKLYSSGVNYDLLVAGALLHDIGKTRELSFLKTIDYSTEGRLIGHHVLGYEIIRQAADGLGFPGNDETIMQLLHLILSHHGSYEHQSPRKPKTIEALLLHLCDDADAKINAFQQITESSEAGATWSQYSRILERFIYLKKLEESKPQ
ncbi:MAG: HD domain-containing protein [Rubrobacteridae bacterium]|nr:HD domain-containing protein [Rubrobacteridae bacterium]